MGNQSARPALPRITRGHLPAATRDDVRGFKAIEVFPNLIIFRTKVVQLVMVGDNTRPGWFRFAERADGGSYGFHKVHIDAQKKGAKNLSEKSLFLLTCEKPACIKGLVTSFNTEEASHLGGRFFLRLISCLPISIPPLLDLLWLVLSTEHKFPSQWGLAEGKGFEPPEGVSSFNDLANRRLQPLGHPSAIHGFEIALNTAYAPPHLAYSRALVKHGLQHLPNTGITLGVMVIELIIFDKDGVLLDLSQTWFPAIVAIARHAETLIEGRVHHRQLLEAIGVMLDADGEGGKVLENGLYASGTYSALVPAWAALDSQLAHIMTHPDFRTEVTRIAATSVKGKTAPKGNVVPALTTLKAEGYLLGLVTNDGEATTTINMRELGLSKLIDKIVTADSGHGKKPEPGGILAICEALNIPPQKTIMIGDTQADHDAAIKANCRHVIAITNTAPNIPDFMPESSYAISDCGALPELMKRMR